MQLQMNAAAKETSGLFNVAQGEPRLSGVALFGLSVGRAVLERASPDLEANVAALECSCFVLLEECPGNAESWFLARCFDELLASGVRGVASFVDETLNESCRPGAALPTSGGATPADGIHVRCGDVRGDVRCR
ncbi:hypothetical protein [Streptomyces sp. yr375]|uniref:hypothetical protein n=1 Tax=Streptomyces sp. yr375 TaxID=1761906 RepID=UPI00210B28DC|nr:hypothetical protein [Streptomyces sp. yr375]